MENTARLGLPLLSPGQAQKEVVHNEALLALDAIVAGCVEEEPRVSAPANPEPGQAFIVAQGAAGDWAGLDGKILSFTSAGWRQLDPFEGLSLKVRWTGIDATYRNGEWDLGSVRAERLVVDGEQVVGSRVGAISAPAGGTVVDGEVRACVGAILDALRAHGLIAST